ncbi:MAG TPA: GspH/FimT family protein [Candidatus Obscuribacterales bacterium]
MSTPLTKGSRTSRGFSVIELVIVIVIVAVLAAMAGPSFREYIASQRIKNASFDLIAALAFARSEALKRNANVHLCAGGTNWATGWTIRIGPNDCSGTALRSQDAFTGLTLTNSADLQTLSYSNDGRPLATTVFSVELPSSISGVKCRQVTIDLSGTARSKEVACS